MGPTLALRRNGFEDNMQDHPIGEGRFWRGIIFTDNMDTLSPAVADAFHLLRQELYEYLDEAGYVADRLMEGDEEAIESACRLIPDLVTVIRSVVVEHKEIKATGECAMCAQDWPCPSIQAIHACLKDPDHEFHRILVKSWNARNNN